MEHVLDVFSVLGDRIELIPFCAVQASPDATLEYPQRVFWNEIFFNFVKDLQIFGLDSGDQNIIGLT